MGIIKNLVGRIFFEKELAKLSRYQQACAIIYRWNGQIPQSSHTAQWISEVGEGKRGIDIYEFRDLLIKGEQPRWHTKEGQSPHGY